MHAPTDPKQPQPEVFRPHRILAVVMAAAGLLWVATGVFLLTFDSVPWKTWAAVVFFILFFAVSTGYYARSAIVVEGESLTFRGILRTRRCGLSEIRKLEILPGLITVYSIRVSEGVMHFTSLFSRHQALARLLVDRSGLTTAPV